MTTQQGEGPSSAYAWYVVGVLTLANVCAFVDRQILALLVVPIRRDLGLSLTEMSYLIGFPFAVFFTLMGLPIARLADASNRRNIIAVGIALWSVMTAACGFAGTFGRLLLARIGVGVGEASLQAPASSMVADYFDRARLGTALSVYQMGIFLGSGVAYLIGGLVVGLVENTTDVAWNITVLGASVARPWQMVFVAVGLPGLLVALLLLSVREPARRVTGPRTLPLRGVMLYVRDHARAFVLLAGGFTLSAAVNWGIAAFLATFLIQSHGWTAARAGLVQGALTVVFGTLGVLAGGRVSDWLVSRGRVDGPLLVGMIGAAGMLVSATAYPFVQSDSAVIAWLVVVNVFAAFPWGAVNSAAAEIVPPAMRAQGIALFYLAVNLVSQMLGPWAVAVITDRVFQSDAALGTSLAIVSAAGMTGAIVLIGLARPAYREALLRRDADGTSQQR